MVKRNGRELVPLQVGEECVTAAPGELAIAESVLQQIDTMMACIEQATNPGEVKNFRAVLVGLQELSEQINHNSQVRYRLAEAKLLAERKIGVMLAKLKMVGGRHKGPALKEMSISWRQSRDWQTLAKLSEEEVRQFVAATQAAARNPSTRSAVRFARQIMPVGKPQPSVKRRGKNGKEAATKSQARQNGAPHRAQQEGFDSLVESHELAKQALEILRQIPEGLDAKFSRLLPRLLSDIVAHTRDALREREEAEK